MKKCTEMFQQCESSFPDNYVVDYVNLTASSILTDVQCSD